MTIFGKILASVYIMFLPLLCLAEDTYATHAPSVEENIRSMDKDHDGMATVYEVRAFVEAKHGKDYKKDVLDDMEASASGKSCSTPFAQSLY